MEREEVTCKCEISSAANNRKPDERWLQKVKDLSGSHEKKSRGVSLSVIMPSNIFLIYHTSHTGFQPQSYFFLVTSDKLHEQDSFNSQVTLELSLQSSLNVP